MQKIEINQSTNRKIKVQTTFPILFPNNILAKSRNKFKERSYLTFYYVNARIKDYNAPNFSTSCLPDLSVIN